MMTQKTSQDRSRVTTEESYPLDSSAVIHLAAHRPDHANTFRFHAELFEEVAPSILQQAVDAITPRFPTIIAGIRVSDGEYRVFPCPSLAVRLDEAPLTYMSMEEIGRCAVRVLHGPRIIAVEAFHSITDGHGVIVFLNTLLATYFAIAQSAQTQASEELGTGAANASRKTVCAHSEFVLDAREAPRAEELADDYPAFAKPPATPPNKRRVYQLPGNVASREFVYSSHLSYPADRLLGVARAKGVSLTTLLTAALFQAVAGIQRTHSGGHVIAPMQIAVPANARRMFGSTTLRNFSLLALPCVEAHQADAPFDSMLSLTNSQLKAQFNPEYVANAMESYVRAQANPLVRLMPLALRMRAIKLVHRLFGARNSCITLSNLGLVHIAPELHDHVKGLRIMLTPRIESPYNCSAHTYSGECRICITRFCETDELTPALKRAIDELLAE